MSSRDQRASKITPSPALRFHNGSGSDDAVRLEAGSITVGRSSDNDCVLSDPHVSRLHAVLRSTDGTVVLIDLGSTAGTTVNDARLAGPQLLHHGDRIGFGPVGASFEDPRTMTHSDDRTREFDVPVEPDPAPALSPREYEVLELMADGLTNAQIGDVLGITERTVKAYGQGVYGKLGVANRAGAVAEAIRRDIIAL